MREKIFIRLLLEPVKRFATGTLFALFGLAQIIFNFSIPVFDWYYWIILGLIIILWGVLDIASKKIASLDPLDAIINFAPSTTPIKQGEKDHERGVLVESCDPRNIEECYADLEKIVFAPNDGQPLVYSYFGRLNWGNRNLQSQDCKRTIERESKNVARFLIAKEKKGNIVIPLCNGEKNLEIKTPGTLHCLIRVGGVVSGVPMKPKYLVSIISIPNLSKQGVTLSVTGINTDIKNLEDFKKCLKIQGIVVSL